VTGIWDNEAAPPREAIGWVFVDRAADPHVEFGGSVTELSVTENCQGQVGDNPACALRVGRCWSILLIFEDLTEPAEFEPAGFS
jgi:hypothetical protein